MDNSIVFVGVMLVLMIILLLGIIISNGLRVDKLEKRTKFILDDLWNGTIPNLIRKVDNLQNSINALEREIDDLPVNKAKVAKAKIEEARKIMEEIGND